MAAFSRQIADAISTDELLPRIAKAAAEGLAAERVRVRVFVGGGEQHFTWPAHAEGPYERTVLVHHHQQPVGEIAIGRKPGDPLQPAEEKLLEDLARQAGPALHNVGLALKLRERIEQVSEQATELRESRQRLVPTQDREWRRLEALQNASKHAPGSEVAVTLGASGDEFCSL